MKEKKFILFFLILAFGMCGNGSSIEVNEPVEEDLETDVNNLEATEKSEETAQTDTNNSDSVSEEKPAVTIKNIKPIENFHKNNMRYLRNCNTNLYTDFFDFGCPRGG